MIGGVHEHAVSEGSERAAARAPGAAAREPRAASLLRMQASAGNRATARLIAREKVEGPSRALLDGEVEAGAAAMAQAAGARELRVAKDDDTRSGLMLGALGIPAPAEGGTKPVPDEATKTHAEVAAAFGMAGAEMAAQGVIESLLRGGGPKAS